MKYIEDYEFIKKQLEDSEVGNVNKLLKRYFVARQEPSNKKY